MSKYADYRMPSERTEVRLRLQASRRKRLIRVVVLVVIGLFLLGVYVDYGVLTCENIEALCEVNH